jgi:nucleotide-binding universal stress UspA family protein
MRLLVLQNVLAATDVDGSGRAALATASELARLAGARLHVVHAGTATGEEHERALQREVERAAPGAEAFATVMAGPPDAVIARAAERTAADVIVLGPHRGGTSAPRPLGGTADAVVREAEVPCLVVPAALVLPLRRVLVPIDLSEPARGALAVALAWASALRRPGAGGDDRTRLTVLHVVGQRDDAPGLDAIRSEVEGVRRRTASFAGVAVEEVEEHAGDAAGAILQVAEREGVELVVMGTRGLGGPAGVLGSVSSAVVRAAPCPVLLVPPVYGRLHADDLDGGG